MPKFYNANHSLTDYALSCGYREYEEKDGVVVELWKEHKCYHVRQHNHNTKERVFWDSFESVTEARKAYRKAGGKYSAIAHSQYDLVKARREWLDKQG